MIAWRPNSTDYFNFVHGSLYGSSVTLLVCWYLGWPITLIGCAPFVVSLVLSIYIRLYIEQRWQKASYVTRLVRYCWFRPLRLIQFCWWILRWAACGLKPLEYAAVVEDEFPGITFSRLETLNHFWTISHSMADYDMQHWFTIDELKERLKSRHDANT